MYRLRIVGYFIVGMGVAILFKEIGLEFIHCLLTVTFLVVALETARKLYHEKKKKQKLNLSR